MRSLFGIALLSATVHSVTAADACTNYLSTILFDPCGTSLATAHCTSSSQSILQVLNPATVCPGCTGDLASFFQGAEDLGCCGPTQDTSSYTGCAPNTYTSFTGLSLTMYYYCSNVTYPGTSHFYCYTSGQQYIQQTAAALTTITTYLAQGQTQKAYWAYGNSTIDCAKTIATECCYPSLYTWSKECGGPNYQTSATNLYNWMYAMKVTCQTFAGVTMDTTTVCPGLPAVSPQQCISWYDPNCNSTNTDDGSSPAAVPTMHILTVLAAVFGFLFVGINRFY